MAGWEGGALYTCTPSLKVSMPQMTKNSPFCHVNFVGSHRHCFSAIHSLQNALVGMYVYLARAVKVLQLAQ